MEILGNLSLSISAKYAIPDSSLSKCPTVIKEISFHWLLASSTYSDVSHSGPSPVIIKSTSSSSYNGIEFSTPPLNPTRIPIFSHGVYRLPVTRKKGIPSLFLIYWTISLRGLRGNFNVVYIDDCFLI